MRKGRNICIWIILVLLAVVLPVLASSVAFAAAPADGEVLYAARFWKYNSLRDTGLRFGTSSWKNAFMAIEEGELRIAASSGDKTYVLLPRPEQWTDTYIVEYTFHFTEVLSSNGYCGFLLSSQGDAPNGRMELILRANGSVDGYTKEWEPLKKSAAEGSAVTVRIGVQYGFLMNITIQCGAESVSFESEHLKALGTEGRGFVLRNASAAVTSVEVVNGMGTGTRSGKYAEECYIAPSEWEMPAWGSTDTEQKSEESGEKTESSPPTGDGSVLYLSLMAAAALTAYGVRRRRA